METRLVLYGAVEHLKILDHVERDCFKSFAVQRHTMHINSVVSLLVIAHKRPDCLQIISPLVIVVGLSTKCCQILLSRLVPIFRFGQVQR